MSRPLRTVLYHAQMIGQVLSFGLLAAPLAFSATFTKDVAPIFFARCAGCHRPNDIAPMSLLDYKSARPWAKVDSRSGAGAQDAAMVRRSALRQLLQRRPALRERDRNHQSLGGWRRAGRRPARPAARARIRRRLAPRQARHRDRYRRGFPCQPGQDAYEHFVVPTNFTEGKWIRAAEIRPGNRKVVHHVHVNVVAEAATAGSTSIEAMTALNTFLIHDGKLTRVRMDAPVVDDACAADAPNLPYLRGFQEGALASFLPGRAPDVFPDGSAKWIPPGSKFEFVIHYARTPGPPQTDRRAWASISLQRRRSAFCAEWICAISSSAFRPARPATK